jgi:AcrR family transcriptional regulator
MVIAGDVGSAMARAKRLGRPVGTNSDETRRRILDVARKHIGEHGYSKATLKDISNEAGLTSGAIYYYFQSKKELVNALIAETNELIVERFEAAAQDLDSLPAKLVSVLEETSDITAETPEISRFSVSARADGPRYPELKESLDKSSHAYFAFYRRMVEKSIADGELAPDVSVQQVSDMCSILNLGLTVLAIQVDQERHYRAIQALEKLIEGTLFTSTAGASASTGARPRRAKAAPRKAARSKRADT